MKKPYFILRLTIIFPLLITILVAGLGLALLYNISLDDPTAQVNLIFKYLVGFTIFSFFIGIALSYALLVPIKRLKNAGIDYLQAYRKPNSKICFEQEIEDLFHSFGQIKSSLDERRKKELFQQLSNLGLMASGIAHEIRNPLASIKGLVNLIDEDLIAADQHKKYTQVITQEINRLEKILNRFLNLTTGKIQDAPPQEIELDSFLNEVIALFKFKPTTNPVNIIKEGQGRLTKVLGYKDRLRQAFLNIILNAYQAMPQGGIIKINILRLNDNFVQISFADTGVGINEKDLDKLFMPFFTTRAENIGLGLAITQQIILAHQGRVVVESKKGKGSKFNVILPINQKQLAQEDRLAEPTLRK